MNLEEYKKEHPHLEKRLGNMETSTKIAEMILDLRDHEGMQLLLKELETFVNNINARLLSSEPLEKEERERLLTDKERCLWLSRVFNAKEQIIEATNKFIEKL